jgi:hypothetical protein
VTPSESAGPGDGGQRFEIIDDELKRIRGG